VLSCSVTSTMGRFLTTVFAGLSELERRIINERTEEGRVLARKQGVKFGRKPTLTSHQRSEVARMLKDGKSIRAIARHFNVGVATIDRIKCLSLRETEFVRFDSFVGTGPKRVHQRFAVVPMGDGTPTIKNSRCGQSQGARTYGAYAPRSFSKFCYVINERDVLHGEIDAVTAHSIFRRIQLSIGSVSTEITESVGMLPPSWDVIAVS